MTAALDDTATKIALMKILKIAEAVFAKHERKKSRFVHPMLAWRNARRITQQELAKSLGVSTAMVCEIELGNKSPSLALAVTISNVTGISPISLREARNRAR